MNSPEEQAPRDTLRERIEDGHVHIMDGAMGTMLYGRGVFVNVCYDELNMTRPELVRGVHEAYVRAGAEILETNTFGGNPVKLSSHGLEDRTEELNRAAARRRERKRGSYSRARRRVLPKGAWMASSWRPSRTWTNWSPGCAPFVRSRICRCLPR
jgi:homocysteine S-methyltransferase